LQHQKGTRLAIPFTGRAGFDYPQPRDLRLHFVMAGTSPAMTEWPAALRQNARNAAGLKFPSRQRAQNEIDRTALRCQLLLGFCGFASC
jgi:hypothetical protein